MLEANDMIEAKLAEIRERKLHEMKRMFAAKMYEAMGSQSYDQMKADLASGKKRRASDVLGLSPYDQAQQDKKDREQGKGAEAPKSKAKRKAAPKAAAPKAAAPKSPTSGDYEGKGNWPHIMVKRAIGKYKQQMNKKPAPPGTSVVNAAKRVSDAPIWSELSSISKL